MKNRRFAYAVAIASLAMGACASAGSRIRPGLANAPALGGATAEDIRVHDATSNGIDSCERLGVGGSPLRDRWPACPGTEPTEPAPMKIVYRGP
jgi:hypothetical protein